jgi:hypothetical protein
MIMALRAFESSAFTTYLNKTLQEKNIPTKSFAKSLNIDASVVRTWLRGDQMPRDPERWSAIATVLETSPQEIQNLVVASLKSRRPNTEKNHPKQYRPFEVKEPHPLETQYLSKPSGVQKGRENLNDALIAMIGSLGKPKGEQSILITFQSRGVVFDSDHIERWNSALKKAIDNGWFVEHIIQGDKNAERTLRTVANLLRYISDRNQYKLRVFKHKKPTDVATGMVIVEGISAMICNSIEHTEYVDSGIFLSKGKDDDKIEIYRKHYNLLRSQSEEAYTEHPGYEQQAILEAFTKCDQMAGDRIVVARRLSEVTRPRYFYEINSNWAKAMQLYYDMGEAELKQHIETREKRHSQFRSLLKNNRCRYIYYADSLNEFIEHGTSYPYYFKATKRERLDQLLETRRLIVSPESNNNFELAIIHEEEQKMIGQIMPSFCEIKGGVVTVMEVPTGTSNKHGFPNHKWFIIENLAITDAFEAYFLDFWERLKDESKGLGALRWINKGIQTLEDQLEIPHSF